MPEWFGGTGTGGAGLVLLGGLEDGQPLRYAGRLAGIPGVLIHGWFDIGGRPDVPWLLHRAWPGL